MEMAQLTHFSFGWIFKQVTQWHRLTSYTNYHDYISNVIVTEVGSNKDKLLE